MNRISAAVKAIGNGMQVKSQLSRLSARTEPNFKLLTECIRKFLAKDFSPEESQWIERVEDIRARCETSEKKLSDLVKMGEKVDEDDVMNRTVGEICRITSKPKIMAVFLFALIRSFQPKRCLEMGCSVGISGCYQAGALKLNGQGQLVTLDRLEASTRVAQEHFDQLKLNNIHIEIGLFNETLPKVIDQYQEFDYAFIDGHHQEEPTLNYTNQIYPNLSRQSVVVYDDISYSEEMKRAWAKIQADPRMTAALDFGHMGVCLVDKDSSIKFTAKMPIFSYIPKFCRA